MKSIIEELYLGNVNPNQKFSPDPLADGLANTISETEEKLYKILSPQEKKLFNEFVNAYDRLNAIDKVKTFTTGFQLATKIMMEATQHENDYLVDR